MLEESGEIVRWPAGRTPLVGRIPQRGLFTEHREQPCGHPAVIMLSGPPGIGKSRVLDELASDWCADDTIVLRGGAWQAEGMPPYLPVLEALGAYIVAAPLEDLRAQLGSRAAILATLLPEIVDRLGSPTPTHPLAPDQERFRLYEAITAFLTSIAASRRVILLLDDLHWADGATCDLLVYVACRARSAALLFAGAYRDGEAEENAHLARALVELNRCRLLVTVRLEPLSAAESKTLAINFLGGEIAPDAAELLHRQGEGNPFFLEELIRALVEDGALVYRDRRWELDGQFVYRLPPRVAEAIRMRLERLDPALVDLLQVAAVVGKRIEPRLLSRVTGTDIESVEDLLRAAARAYLLRPDGDDGYAFSHDMVRETLYAEVGRERRRRLHQATGEALAANENDHSSRLLADLAFHFAQAGEKDRGVTYALAAGEESLRMSAASEALAHYRTALRLLEDSHRDQRAAALMGLGDAATLSGDYPQAGESYDTAGEDFLAAGDSLGAARASRQLGRVRWRQEAGTEAMQAFRRAVELLGPEDSADAAEVLMELANLLVTTLGRYPEGVAKIERALAMTERLGDRRLQARVLCVMGNIEARRNNLDAGRTTLAHSLALANALGDFALAAEACAYLANISAWTGDLEQSRAYSLRRLALAQRTHDPFELRHVHAWIGVTEMIQGNWSEAERWFAQQEQALEGLQTPEPLATLRSSQGLMHYYRGRFDKAERALSEAVTTIRPMGAGQLVWHLGRLGLALVELRPRAEALACFAELHALADRFDRHSSAWLGAFAFLAVGYARLGERKHAAGCYQNLLPFRGQFAPISADRALGLAAAAAGDHVSAHRHLADAEAQTRAAGIRPELALTLLERGRLEQRPSTGGVHGVGASRVRHIGPVVEGLRLCEDLGMQELARRIVGPAPAEPRPAGLSERELEVLRLVAEGQSNREIAAALFLSEHTVARHLTHIFTKVGVENRAGAAVFALRHNIV